LETIAKIRDGKITEKSSWFAGKFKSRE